MICIWAIRGFQLHLKIALKLNTCFFSITYAANSEMVCNMLYSSIFFPFHLFCWPMQINMFQKKECIKIGREVKMSCFWCWEQCPSIANKAIIYLEMHKSGNLCHADYFSFFLSLVRLYNLLFYLVHFYVDRQRWREQQKTECNMCRNSAKLICIYMWFATHHRWSGYKKQSFFCRYPFNLNVNRILMNV